MKETLYRKELVRQIGEMKRAAEVTGAVDHHGLKGRLREIGLEGIVGDLLPNGVEVGTGIIIDSDGNQSAQIDLIIYSTRVLPRFFKRAEQVIVPVEACIQAIEVKSTLNASEIRDSIRKAESVKNLHLMLSETNIRVCPVFTVFAFRSDLVSDGKSEWDRYEENKPASLKNRVVINDICVVERGHWTTEAHVKPSTEYDEVISMLALAANSVPAWIKYRGTPVFGKYLQRSGSE